MKDLIESYKSGELSGEISPEQSHEVFSLIKYHGKDGIHFLNDLEKKTVTIDQVENFEKNFCLYSKLLNLICRTELRRNTPSIEWDKKLNDFCLELKEDVEKFQSMGMQFSYDELTDQYNLYTSANQFSVQAHTLYYILKDILKEKDSPELFCYYLVLRYKKDMKSIKTFWAYSQLIFEIKKDRALNK